MYRWKAKRKSLEETMLHVRVDQNQCRALQNSQMVISAASGKHFLKNFISTPLSFSIFLWMGRSQPIFCARMELAL